MAQRIMGYEMYVEDFSKITIFPLSWNHFLDEKISGKSLAGATATPGDGRGDTDTNAGW